MIEINKIEEMESYLTPEEYQNLLAVSEMGGEVYFGFSPCYLRDIIQSSFLWHLSPQGWSYWNAIQERLESLYGKE